MLGGVVSTLFTGKEQLEEFPAASVTVIVTVVLPTPDTEVPGIGNCVTTREPVDVQLSLFVISDL
jgi:hypothetical protein